MSPAEPILRRLDATRQKWWIFTLLTTVVVGICVSCIVLMVLMSLDAAFRFSQGPLAACFAVWSAATLVPAAIILRRLAGRDRTLEAAARRVEYELPELGSDLINLVQLASDSHNVDRAFCEAAVRSCAVKLDGVAFDAASQRETRRGRFVHCMQTPRDFVESLVLAALLLVAAFAAQRCVPGWGSAASRVLRPWAFVPSVGSVRIIDVAPKDVEVLVGATVEVTAEIENPDGRTYPGMLYATPEGEEETATVMTADEGLTRFRASITPVVKPVTYRLEIGDSQSSCYRIRPREKPAIAEVQVTMKYPEYLARPPETFMQRDADLEGPEYGTAELRIRPTVPVVRGEIMSEGRTYGGRTEEDGLCFEVSVPLLRDSTFTVKMIDAAGLFDPNPRINQIRVRPDKPPAVEMLRPGRQSNVAPGAGVPVVIRATDDHAVGRVVLEMKVKDAESESAAPGVPSSPGAVAKEKDSAATVVREWTKLEGTTTVVVEHRLELPVEKFRAGQVVMIRALAYDRRNFHEYGRSLGPQEADGGWHSLCIVDADKKAAAAVERIETLRAELWKLLEKQTAARVASAKASPSQDAAARTEILRDVRDRQVALRKDATSLAQSAERSPSDEFKTIHRVLSQLVAGEMVQAVQCCDDLLKQAAAPELKPALGRLATEQDRIIAVLRKLLNAARQAEADALAEMKKRPGADLPDDTKKKLEEMKKKLEEFLKAQKKVIEGSESLAKKATEDFSDEELQALKDLAKAEDDWAKFMKEMQNDLSKLPEQDFANASIAKELVEIQTELKMAEDALTAKSADIAVPLEQLGYERAEEMTTNIEKWLPDSPDREKWSQEESLSDADKEAPMAELPGELEDLIGDLMEEEEDLFDEMEDVTSSAVDSLDKGAGWDALDGPISNMSARGVTGNRLPNTSEIGGRSGEGRQGKSSGEFVGDEAVGKGGRRTPTRLTPDPIMKGQIKDHSKDPTGGATGGGKESGQGGEGLEGPVPNSKGRRDLGRLAGKQAALRNKAESVDAKFQVSNFHHTDLKKMVGLMQQVENDLKAGNYQNALRQRQVLTERMGNVKQYLEGEFQVRKDATSNLPAEIQKEILGGMQEGSPAGWEELNRQYFERLSTGSDGASSGSAAMPAGDAKSPPSAGQPPAQPAAPAAPQPGTQPTAPAAGKPAG